MCTSGVCGGIQNTCPDAVTCTLDSCNEQLDSCEHTPDNSFCDDGLFCNGMETCDLATGCQPGTSVDCSANNLPGIATCTNVPDNNSLTWDFRMQFTSQCIEPGTCTNGNETITNMCSVSSCSAQCDATHLCEDTDCNHLDGCNGKDYYDYSDVPNTCLGDCTCTDNQCGTPAISYNDPRCTECQNNAQCDNLDKDYCVGDLVKHDEGKCVDFNCTAETTVSEDCNSLDINLCDGTKIEFNDYTCEAAACMLNSITPVEECDNGLYCDGQESCVNAQCTAGTPPN